MVSKASEDLPEPERPVMTTSESRGSSTVTSLRLCSRAPATTMDSWRDITPPGFYGGARRNDANRCSFPALSGREQPGVLELGAQVRHERVDAEILPGHAGEQLARVELAAVAVHVLPQPLAQDGEVARLDPRPDVGHVGLDALPQLRRHQVADGVGREVADQPGAPVGVLEHALRVAGHLEPEQALDGLVPGGGHIVDLQRALHQRELEL